MNIVWVLTGLWGHYFALFAYYTFGIRKDSMVEVAPVESMKMDMKMPMEMDMPDMRPKWQSITLSAFHCGRVVRWQILLENGLLTGYLYG